MADDILLNIIGPAGESHELLAEPSDLADDIRKRLAVLTGVSLAQIRLWHGHNEVRGETPLSDFSISGPRPITMNISSPSEGSSVVQASSPSSEHFWRERGLRLRVGCIRYDDLDLREEVQSVGIHEINFETNISGNIADKEAASCVAIVRVSGHEVIRRELNLTAKTKSINEKKAGEELSTWGTQAFAPGDTVEMWIEGPPTKGLSELAQQSKFSVEYYWSLSANVFSRLPLLLRGWSSRVEVRCAYPFNVHFSDSDGATVRSVEFEANVPFLCKRRAPQVEVDDAQGFLVLRDGFHVGVPLGVAVEAPIGTDLGLPPVGGFVVLQAMRPPEASQKDECFTVLCDSCCHLMAEFGHLRIEPGYGLESGRYRFHGLTQLPKGVSAVMRVHRGIWKKPLPSSHEQGSALSDAGNSATKSDTGRSKGRSDTGRGGAKSDAGLSGLSSRKSGAEAEDSHGSDDLPSALHCCVPLVGLNGFEPEITVLGQCWREPPYKEDAPFIRATVVLPEDISSFMAFGESRMEIRCPKSFRVRFRNWAKLKDKEVDKAWKVPANVPVVCHRRDTGYYIGERPYCLTMVGGFPDLGSEFASSQPFDHPAFSSTAPFVSIGGKDYGCPIAGGCVMLVPNQKLLLGTRRYEEEKPDFEVKGTSTTFVTATWPFRVHFCSRPELAASQRHVTLPPSSLLKVSRRSPEAHELTGGGQIMVFRHGFDDVELPGFEGDHPRVHHVKSHHNGQEDVEDLGLPESGGSVLVELLYDIAAHHKLPCYDKVKNPYNGKD